jgi:acyl-CoA synthetase (AMP-forming)/AMP-acid ligase II/acyl carrier protein
MKYGTRQSSARPAHRNITFGRRQSGLEKDDTSSKALRTIGSMEDGHTSSVEPLTQLRNFLASSQSSCSLFELILCYARCWRQLPEATKSGRDTTHEDLVESTLRLVKSSYDSLLDLIPEGDSPAIVDANTRECLSHRDLLDFVSNFRISGAQSGTVVALALPNGPLFGLLAIAIAAHYTLAPLNVTSSKEQFQSDLANSGAKVLLAFPEDIKRLECEAWTRQYGVQVNIVRPTDGMTCTISTLFPVSSTTNHPSRPNGPDDICLILFTSGTTGAKKVVPYTLHNIISGVAFVGKSWRLSNEDVCLNMMPINHIGGFLRNLFSPILFGGSTICCSAFDPNLFWDLVTEKRATWYYASPSMHSAILDEASFRNIQPQKSRIRMVCNAAGGLLPSLAVRLRDIFQCTVLPSYGMTECMPISTPPIDYALERPGTSGISVGPELAILDGNDRKQRYGVVGRVCVRGNPAFPGYLLNGQLDKSIFTQAGWFDTGDLGYMDSEGYLYITGRSKEVINRGGEIISPFEVEEAIMTAARTEGSSICGRVAECLAFSLPHQTLQETVGIVIVTTTGQERVDLRQVQEAVKSSLHSTKWPVVAVYMDSVPKRSGKLCRVRLGQRLGFRPFAEDTKMLDRHFQAICPPPDTPLNVGIPISICTIDQEKLVNAIAALTGPQVDTLPRINTSSGLLDAVLAPTSSLGNLHNLDTNLLRQQLHDILPGYLLPARITTIHSPFPRDLLGNIDFKSLNDTLTPSTNRIIVNFPSTLESKVRHIYSDLLNVSMEDVQQDSDFFELGGDSLKAGRLLSRLRKEFNIRLRIDRLFASSSVRELCKVIDGSQPTPKSEINPTELPLPDKTYSSSNIITLIINLLPLTVLSPFKKAFFWIAFLKCWGFILSRMHRTESSGNLIPLLISMVTARAILGIVMPFFAIGVKWILIGRYKEGLYPMWSGYHNRWWLTQKVIDVSGMGIFGHFNWSRVLFYRLLGAKIGKSVLIQKGTILGEYDLLDIGDEVELDRCICRPFAAERNTTMYLGKIRMGNRSAAGLKTVIAAGADIPEDVCLGISSSSWEWRDAKGSNYSQLKSKIPEPHLLLWLLVACPVLVAVKTVSLVPWIAGLYGLNVTEPPPGTDLMIFLVGWFSNPTRVGFHFLARVLHLIFGPIVFLAITILVKSSMDLAFGVMRPTLASQRSQIDRLRTSLLNTLVPNGDISEVSGLFGTHYEITSKIVRALGAKVGKRVYWPGNGPSIQNFDFLQVGNDVVFGSRSHIITSDGIGSDYVRIADGANVADRVVMQPGSNLGKHTVLGSGTLTQRDTSYIEDSVWIGSKAGGPVCLSENSTPIAQPPRVETSVRLISYSIPENDELSEKVPILTEYSSSSSETSRSSADEHPLLSKQDDDTASSPFGRAFYENQSPYKVYGLSTIICYSVFINTFISVYWNVPTILSLQILSKVSRHSFLSTYFSATAYRPFLILGTLFTSFSILHVTFSMLALAICIIAKWVIIGRRQPGDYDWDQSSYCQRWQLLLTIERIRRKQVGGEDILAMLTGTHYLATYFRLLGADIGRDCALFAGGEISLPFTEPDLLTLGDRVAVDDASLVAHINSRGNFKLNRLAVGDRSVLRTGSRLLSGATMGSDSCLLEHTLVMAGDEVENGVTCQGWPADEFSEEKIRLVNEAEAEQDSNEKTELGNVDESTSVGLIGRLFGRRTFSFRYSPVTTASEGSICPV